MRTFVSAAVALVLCAGSLSAADYKGKVQSVDTTKNTITISVDGKDMTFTVAKDAKFTGGKKIAEQLAAEGLKHPVFAKTGKKAATVSITSEDGKVATAIKVGGKKGGKKKKTDA